MHRGRRYPQSARGGWRGLSRFRRGFHLQLDVVDADHFTSVNVDDLLIEQIAFQEKQPFRTVRSGPVRKIVEA